MIPVVDTVDYTRPHLPYFLRGYTDQSLSPFKFPEYELKNAEYLTKNGMEDIWKFVANIALIARDKDNVQVICGTALPIISTATHYCGATLTWSITRMNSDNQSTNVKSELYIDRHWIQTCHNYQANIAGAVHDFYHAAIGQFDEMKAPIGYITSQKKLPCEHPTRAALEENISRVEDFSGKYRLTLDHRIRE